MSTFFDKQEKERRARDAQIRQWLLDGKSRLEIERKLDLSRQRLAQIILRLRAEDAA